MPLLSAAQPSRELRAALAMEDWDGAVDAAVALGARGRNALPTRLHAGFDAIALAFTRYESGHDDAARATLNTIGLTSPFVDWKVLLRGLIAYAAGDDARALGNWSRLDEQRLPAQLAAPLRAVLDRAIRAAQPGARQRKLRDAADRLQGMLPATLRAIQANLGRPERLPAALADLAAILPRIRREAPDLEPLLTRACYSAALGGHPDGARALKALFDPPADDPTWDRLQALAAERRGEWREANRHWRRYDAALEHHGDFSDDDRRRARALVWCCCGANASQEATAKARTEMETCYRRALAIDPGVREAYESLFEYYCAAHRLDGAIAIGRRLAELDPTNAAIAAELGRLARRHCDWDAAIEWFSRARSLTPFDRELIAVCHIVRRARARQRALTGDAAGAAADLEAIDAPPTIALLCQRAALAHYCGGTTDGDRLVAEARGQNAAAAALALAAEATRLKMPRAMRAPHDTALRAAFAGPADVPSAIALAEIVYDQGSVTPEYRGQSGHQTKVRRYVVDSLWSLSSASDGERLCAILERLRWTKLLREAAQTAAERFPEHAVFPYYEARGLWLERGESGSWKVGELLSRAQRLAQALPPHDPRARDWLTKIAGAKRKQARSPVSLLDFVEMFDE
jgi:tetratricopeptide (TPR) repeat protein